MWLYSGNPAALGTLSHHMGVIILAGLYLSLVVHRQVLVRPLCLPDSPLGHRGSVRTSQQPPPTPASQFQGWVATYISLPQLISQLGRRESLVIPSSHLPHQPQRGRQKEEAYTELLGQSAHSFQGLEGKNSSELGKLVKKKKEWFRSC